VEEHACGLAAGKGRNQLFFLALDERGRRGLVRLPVLPEGLAQLVEVEVQLRVNSREQPLLAAAVDLGHDHIGSEHLLLGLTAAGGLGGRVLAAEGATPDALRPVLVTLIAGRGR